MIEKIVKKRFCRVVILSLIEFEWRFEAVAICYGCVMIEG